MPLDQQHSHCGLTSSSESTGQHSCNLQKAVGFYPRTKTQFSSVTVLSSWLLILTVWITVCIVVRRDIQLTTTVLFIFTDAQRDGRPAKYRWCPLFNATKFGWCPLLECHAVTLPRRELLKLPGVPQTNETISAASGPKFTILWRHVEEILLLNKFFSDCRYVP